MRTTVIITRRGEGYISTASGRFGGGHQGARANSLPCQPVFAGLAELYAGTAASERLAIYAERHQQEGEAQ